MSLTGNPWEYSLPERFLLNKLLEPLKYIGITGTFAIFTNFKTEESHSLCSTCFESAW